MLRLGSLLLAAFTITGSGLTAAEIDVCVEEPNDVACNSWPVTSGIPFAQGSLKDKDPVALFSADGVETPLQTETLSRWPDGSVRWLLLDFQVNLLPREVKRFVLRSGSSVERTAVDDPLRIDQERDAITIDTGPLRVKLIEGEFRLLDQVWLDGNHDGAFSGNERVTTSQGAGIVLTTPDGRQFRADLAGAEITVEQTGPLRGCVRIAGIHAGDNGHMFRYVVRLHAFRGQPFVRMNYTFVNDHQDETMTKIDSLELVFSPASRKQALLDGKHAEFGHLFQIDDQRFEINGQAAGKRATGWAALGDERGGLAVGVRKFWQNWPKSIAADDDGIRVGICPQFPDRLYDGKPLKEEAKIYYYLRDGVYNLKLGVARSHELWATFFDGSPSNDLLDPFYRSIDKPLLAQCKATYVRVTQAIGDAPPADPNKFHHYDEWLDGFFRLHLEDQDTVREYGLLNYGDWFNVKWDSWGNLEYDTARCFFTQYLRTGDRRYFDRAEQAARHFIDVDILHATNQEIREFGGSFEAEPGHIWAHTVGHTGGYFASYVDGKYVNEAPLAMKGAYQVGMMDTGHAWIGGVFDYYQLTGDRRARTVAKMASDNMAGRCPTRYTDHIRGVGWPLSMMLAAYEATGDPKHLAAATKQWQRLKKHFDAEKGWVVMMAYGHCSKQSTAERCRGQNAYMLALTLSGLARYHRITKDPEVLEALSVGLDQLIGDCWSEEHQSFYLGSCIHNRQNPPPALASPTFLSAEAFAHEFALTGDKEHRRIFRAAFRTAVNAGFRDLAVGKQQGQTGYSSMMFLFTPFGLSALED
ncbi:MAG: hypothetical protein CMJ64_23215 [Planctomycetaceae bacterium]|nr:hypothetical protein [Planctomycetaceae bacterium]